jgi:hypothetical protein
VESAKLEQDKKYPRFEVAVFW